VTEIETGDDGFFPSFFVAAPGGVYFVAGDPTHGRELWWSDGTTAGTHLVVDLQPGPFPLQLEGPSHLAWLPGVGLIFAADDGVHGRELWLTQGTAATTVMLAEIQPGESGSMLIQGLAWTVAGEAFFVANDGLHGLEPWVTDGTPTGTFMLGDLLPGDGGSDPRAFFPFGDAMLFGASINQMGVRPLWRSDGTPAGTIPLGDAAHANDHLDPYSFTELDGFVYFSGYQNGTGRELWRTDGTLEGTRLAVEVWPGQPSGVETYYSLSTAQGRLWFPGTTAAHGSEWWQSDGTAGGTFEVYDLVAGPGRSIDPWDAGRAVEVDGRVLVVATDSARRWAVRSALPGVPGTAMVENGGDGSVQSCGPELCPSFFTPLAAGVAFTGFDGAHGAEPWRSDGTGAGTRLVADLAPGLNSSVFPAYTLYSRTPLGDDLLLIATDCDDADGNCPDSTYQLRRADADGNVTPLTSEPWFDRPGELATWHDAGYFAAENGLWRSDGTPAGTARLSGGPGGPVGPHWFTPGAESLYFVAGGLWKTDGTPAGTVPVAAALSSWLQRPLLTVSGGEEVLYFAAYDAAGGNELWTSDGTNAGTRRVVDLRSGTESGVPIVDLPGLDEERQPLLAAVGAKAFFPGDDGTAGEELWVSNGSPGNATLLEVRPGPSGSQPRWLTSVGSRVYFVADDGVHGREPWVSDGTAAGTHLVADVLPGPDSSSPKELVDWMGRLVFAADDDVHGMELWRGEPDGTGARLVVDLRPGVGPASPQGLTAVGERLYLFADDGTTGLEPWVWSAASELFRDGFETGAVDRWSSATAP